MVKLYMLIEFGCLCVIDILPVFLEIKLVRSCNDFQMKYKQLEGSLIVHTLDIIRYSPDRSALVLLCITLISTEFGNVIIASRGKLTFFLQQ